MALVQCCSGFVFVFLQVLLCSYFNRREPRAASAGSLAAPAGNSDIPLEAERPRIGLLTYTCLDT